MNLISKLFCFFKKHRKENKLFIPKRIESRKNKIVEKIKKAIDYLGEDKVKNIYCICLDNHLETMSIPSVRLFYLRADNEKNVLKYIYGVESENVLIKKKKILSKYKLTEDLNNLEFFVKCKLNKISLNTNSIYLDLLDGKINYITEDYQ